MNRAVFRELAGIFAALLAVAAFVVSGYAVMTAELVFDKKIALPDIWFSGLISLSSAAFGFLIGKQTSRNDTPEPPPMPVLAPPVAMPPLPSSEPGCTVPGCPLSKETPPYESS